MARLNKELFNYYTQPENIDCIVNIYRDFAMLKQQLLEEFWTEVNSEIGRRVDQKEWFIEFTNSFDEYEIEISLTPANMIYENNKSACWVTYWDCSSRCFLRLWVSDEFKYDYSAIMKKGDEYKSLNWKPVKFAKKGDNVVLWQWADLDFTQLESLDAIIPINRKVMVDKFAQRIIDAAITLKPLLQTIYKSKK